MTKKEKEQIAKLSREDIEAVVRHMCIASVRHDEALARMNAAIARAKENYEPDLAALAATWDQLERKVEFWASAHPELFASRRSIEFVHGTIGFRLGQPALKPKSGLTWAKIIERLREIAPAYIRTKHEADKDSLIKLPKEELSGLGLVRAQAERFFVDAKKEAVELGGAK